MLWVISPIFPQETDYAAIVNELPKRKIDGRELVDVDFPLLTQYFLSVHNTIKQAEFDILISEKNTAAAQGKYSPTLVLGYTNSKALSPTIFAQDIKVNTILADAVTASLSQLSSSGNTYTLLYALRKSKNSNHTFNSDYNHLNTVIGSETYNGSLGVSVNIPLFKDGEDATRYSERIAENATLQAKQRKEDLEFRIINNSATVYWNIVGLYQQVESQKNRIEWSQQTVRHVTSLFKLGRADRTTLTEASLRLDIDKLKLESYNLQILDAEDKIKNAVDVFKSLPYGIYPSQRPRTRSIKGEVSLLAKNAVNTSTQMKLLNSQLAKAQLDLLQQKNLDELDLDLNLQYTLNGIGDGFGKNHEFFAESRGHTYSFGVAWNIPLGNSGIQEKISSAKLQREKISDQIEQQENNITEDIELSLRRLILKKDEILSLKKKIELSERILETQSEKQRIGRGRILEVFEAQSSLSNAKKDYIFAQVAYEIEYVRLMTLSGKMNAKTFK